MITLYLNKPSYSTDVHTREIMPRMSEYTHNTTSITCHNFTVCLLPQLMQISIFLCQSDEDRKYIDDDKKQWKNSWQAGKLAVYYMQSSAGLTSKSQLNKESLLHCSHNSLGCHNNSLIFGMTMGCHGNM